MWKLSPHPQPEDVPYVVTVHSICMATIDDVYENICFWLMNKIWHNFPNPENKLQEGKGKIPRTKYFKESNASHEGNHLFLCISVLRFFSLNSIIMFTCASN